MTRFGMVHSFDGYTQVPKADQLKVLAESKKLGIDNPCYFVARVRNDDHVSCCTCILDLVVHMNCE